MISRKVTVIVILITGILLVMWATPPTEEMPTNGRVLLWHEWQGVEAQVLNDLIAEFTALHPGVEVITLFTTYTSVVLQQSARPVTTNKSGRTARSGCKWRKSHLDTDTQRLRELFLSGQVAYYVGPSSDLPSLRAALAETSVSEVSAVEIGGQTGSDTQELSVAPSSEPDIDALGVASLPVGPNNWQPSPRFGY